MTDENTSTETQETAPSEKTFSQDEVNSLVAAEKRRVKASYEDYDAIKEQASKVEGLTSQLAEASKRADDALLDALRSDVAREKNVPLSALTAGDRESLEAQAQSLIDWRGTETHAVKRESNGSSNASANSGLDAKARAAQALRDLR